MENMQRIIIDEKKNNVWDLNVLLCTALHRFNLQSTLSSLEQDTICCSFICGIVFVFKL